MNEKVLDITTPPMVAFEILAEALACEQPVKVTNRFLIVLSRYLRNRPIDVKPLSGSELEAGVKEIRTDTAEALFDSYAVSLFGGWEAIGDFLRAHGREVG